MTQAFNLSQLGNRVNTSGQLDASTGLVNITPVANGGTGRSSVTSGNLLVGAGTGAMTLLAGAALNDAVVWNGSAWVSGSAGGVPPTVSTFVAPGNWDTTAKIAAGVKAIKVTVVGGGGNGGSSAPGSPLTGYSGGGGGGGAAIEWITIPSIPAPVAITAGSGTNSFGAFCSATAGATGGVFTGGVATALGGAGGSGSGGNINVVGDAGGYGMVIAPAASVGGNGGNSILGGGARPIFNPGGTNSVTSGIAGSNYGGGGGGGGKNATTQFAGGTGAPGIVIVEEFY
jgi:hypothetical protein